MTGTYTKLQSGNWGIRTQAKPEPGQEVQVFKRAGGSKVEIVQQVVWTDGKVWLCAIAPKAKTPIARQRRGFVPCGYPGCSPAYCDECDGEGRYGR